MPKKIDPRGQGAVRAAGAEHRQEYPSLTAAAAAVARQLGRGQGVGAPLGGAGPGRWRATGRGATSEELAEIKELKAENRRLREDNEILRAASIFFAGELDPRNR